MTDPSPWWDRESTPTGGRSCWRAAASFRRSASGFAGAGFLEVDPPALQVSPGNEIHLHAFATELATPGGGRAPLYLHTSPEFTCKKLLAAGEPRFLASPMCSATASADRRTIPSSPCWSGIERTSPTKR